MEREEELASTELLALQVQLNEKIARLMRLRKQRLAVVKRGHEMVRRGLKSMDELEAAERSESEQVASVVQSVEAFAPTDWSTVGLEEFDFSSLLPDGTSVGVAESSEGFR